MWNNRNDLAIRQQFRADFRMTPDTFIDTVTLVSNRIKKQDTRFREAVSNEKWVATAWALGTPTAAFQKPFLLENWLW